MSSKRKHSDSFGSESEGEGKSRNRTVIEKRERQWQTVASSDDDASNSSSSSSESSSSESDRSAHKRKHHDKKESKKKRSKEKESKHKKKKDKDKKHHKKEHKKDKKKEKKHHKDKHEKKSSYSSKSVNQNEYGKYGIIKEEHFFHKQREFEVYMAEVKGVHGVMSEGKREIMQHFKSYMEDYNTATMPHDKYYNYEAWEMAEYKRQQLEQHRQRAAQAEEEDGSCPPFSFNDEEIRKKELRKIKLDQENQEFLALKQKMTSNKDVQESMRRQAQLNTELQQAFKRGDTATVKRLERLLAPEEMKAVVKHPWA